MKAENEYIEMARMKALPKWISFSQKLFKIWRKGNNLNGICRKQELVYTGEKHGKKIYWLIEEWLLHIAQRKTQDRLYTVSAKFTTYDDYAHDHGELLLEFTIGLEQDLLYKHYFDQREKKNLN